MNYILGSNRGQFEFGCLEDAVEQDNQVRFIEAFVEKLDLKSLKFVVKELKGKGRPSYEPKIFLNYTCMVTLMVSEAVAGLGRECKRNIELLWF